MLNFCIFIAIVISGIFVISFCKVSARADKYTKTMVEDLKKEKA